MEKVMGNWGDDVDYEAKGIKDYEGRFTMNFKKIYMDVDEISERTLEVTQDHPRDSLDKLWFGAMAGIFIFMLFSYQILALVTLPFICFYLVAVVRIGKCWKSFKYSPAKYWIRTVVSLVVMLLASQLFLHQIDCFLP